MRDELRAEWGADLASLSFECGSRREDESSGNCLRTIIRLLILAPQPDLLKGLPVINPSRMQTLVAAGAFESAVVELMGPKTEWAVTIGTTGNVATVTLPDASEAAVCTAPTFTQAVVGAFARALAERARIETAPGSSPAANPGQALYG